MRKRDHSSMTILQEQGCISAGESNQPPSHLFGDLEGQGLYKRNISTDSYYKFTFHKFQVFVIFVKRTSVPSVSETSQYLTKMYRCKP